MKKQLFGLVLALILCFTMLPISAFAAVEDTFTVDSITYKILTEDTAAGTGTVSVGDGENQAYTDDSPADLTIPNTVTYNGITYTVTAIGDLAFNSDFALTSVAIPDSVTGIGIFAFSGTSLTSVTIPNKVTKISDHAFAFTSLTSITIPASVTEIEQYAFFQCFALSSVEILGPITKINDFTFASTGLPSITIPSTVTEIGVRAFNACTSLESVIIPEGVASIGTGAFAYCDLLTEITIPESVTAIGELAFADCTALETVVFLGNPDLPENALAVSDTDSSPSPLNIYFPHQYAEKYNHIINGNSAAVGVPLYKLTVKNGVATEGTLPQSNAVGYYTSGDELTIVANDIPAGSAFEGWTVDPETTEAQNNLGDPQKTTTTFTMPSSDVILTANYADADGGTTTDPPVETETVQIAGATIKTETDVSKQGMRYEVTVDAAQAADAQEFGVLLLPETMLGTAELTLDVANVLRIRTVNGDKYWDDILADGGFQAVLTNGTINGRQNLKIVSRSYVIGADGTVAYGEVSSRSITSVVQAIAQSAIDGGATATDAVTALLSQNILSDSEIATVITFCRDNIAFL